MKKHSMLCKARMSEDGMMYTGNMATLDIEKCNCDFMQNTPKTIEDRIKELREITIKIEDLINTRILNKYLGLKTIKQEVAKDNLSEKFNIKLQELLSEQDRISRESEREKIIELFKNGEWRKMIDKNGGNDFDVMTRAFLQTLTNKE